MKLIAKKLNPLFYCLSLWVTLLVSPHTAESYIGKKEFLSIHSISQEILEMYPKDQYVYLGIGRSPVAIMAYLTTETGTLAHNIPFSATSGVTNRLERLTPEQERRLFEHLTLMLPKDSDLGGRTRFLLIDYIMTGTGLVFGQEYLTKYFQNLGKDFEVKSFGITDPRGPDRILNSSLFDDAFSKINHLYLLDVNFDDPLDPDTNDHCLMKMGTKLYSLYAEFETWRVKDDSAHSPLRHEDAYAKYLREMASAKADPDSLDDLVNLLIFEKLRDSAHPEELLLYYQQINESNFIFFRRTESSLELPEIQTQGGASPSATLELRIPEQALRPPAENHVETHGVPATESAAPAAQNLAAEPVIGPKQNSKASCCCVIC